MTNMLNVDCVFVWFILGINQCCGSGSGIRCLFDPWIRDPEKVFSGSRISDPGSQTHIFESLVTIFWIKSSIILLKLAQIFFFSTSKLRNFQFCEICGYMKRYDNKFLFTPLFCCCFWIRDPRSGIRDG